MACPIRQSVLDLGLIHGVQAASVALAQKLSTGASPTAAHAPSPTPPRGRPLPRRPKSPRPALVRTTAPPVQQLGQSAHHSHGSGPSDFCVKCGQTLPGTGSDTDTAGTSAGKAAGTPPGPGSPGNTARDHRQNKPNPSAAAGGAAAAAAGAHQPAPSLAADVDEHGRIVGARDDFHQDSSVQRPGAADSGTAYRDKNWNELVRRAQDKVGPKQTPFHERETLADRSAQLQAAQINETSREGVRVNPASDKRAYAIDGYEKEVYIDPNRSIDVPLPRGRPEQPAPYGDRLGTLR